MLTEFVALLWTLPIETTAVENNINDNNNEYNLDSGHLVLLIGHKSLKTQNNCFPHYKRFSHLT